MTDNRRPREIIIRILKQTNIFSGYVVIRSMDEFIKKYESLSEDLCLFVDRFFADANNLSINTLSMEVICSILSIVVSLSDKTPLVPMFVRAGYAEKAISWMGKLSFRDDTSALDVRVIVIIHNLARHKNGLRSLREHNAFEALMKCKPLLNLGPDVEIDSLTHAFGMALIALATSDSDQKENEEFIRKISDELYSMCQKAADPANKLLKPGEYHLSELLVSLECAFSNTSILRHMLGDNKSGVRPEPIQFFAQLLASFYGSLFNQENDYLEELVGMSLLRLLLCISNYEDYRKELTKHDQFCVLIEGLAKRSKQDTAKRICCNLEVKPHSEAPLSQLKVQKQPMIFISYHWDDIDLCAEFVAELNELTNAPVWIDYENIGWSDEDKWDKIASAIQSATVIIVLVSSAYCQSIFNFQELNYAEALSQSERKSFIFVELEPDTANMREWLSNLISNLSKANEIVSYKDNIHQMVQEMVEENKLLKKRAMVTRLTDTVAQSRICTIM